MGWGVGGRVNSSWWLGSVGSVGCVRGNTKRGKTRVSKRAIVHASHRIASHRPSSMSTHIHTYTHIPHPSIPPPHHNPNNNPTPLTHLAPAPLVAKRRWALRLLLLRLLRVVVEGPQQRGRGRRRSLIAAAAAIGACCVVWWVGIAVSA